MERTRIVVLFQICGRRTCVCLCMCACTCMHNVLTVHVADTCFSLMPFTEINIKYSKALIWLHNINHNYSEIHYLLKMITLLSELSCKINFYTSLMKSVLNELLHKCLILCSATQINNCWSVSQISFPYGKDMTESACLTNGDPL